MSTPDWILLADSAHGHRNTAPKMCTGKEYLELVSFLAQAKPPKPQELRPCNQHEILLQLICHRKEPLSKSQLADLLWNMTTGPKRKFKRRQCGGMEGRNPLEPTDVEVVFGCREKTPPSSIALRGWGRSRIEWLRKLEAQQRQYCQAWQETLGADATNEAGMKSSKKETECGNSTKKDKACEKHGKKDQAGGREKDRHKERTRTRTKRKLPGFWALLPFSCGSNLTHDSSSQDVPHRRKSS
ncbi:uncharacterized protein LOC6552974 [Drosophila erecta]|uniref:uncharacterized protein LOC6552974 n=1 Tax=Drosophila erecta TaxID=7220 RepID=UPI0007327793|nr:uncharacterized protein LOC6552974 [Drosophila erecta]EDV49073.2 uncharacterized protein Dere_GG16960 [Drosophila erecta]